jgi:hypothetical protein
MLIIKWSCVLRLVDVSLERKIPHSLLLAVSQLPDASYDTLVFDFSRLFLLA